ncbi:hypothetical protein CALCODRAFT_506073 [Calocera cornea HHB12733]|uniref:Uncharacterized protein n=1 Tax=Calocera cornea HHB12733 TaxID=1353952 RepID=A0A165JEV9_9BASI|nr:hypothetical protein CALCODRAFT_506073 [Calocera cornea HHB12733]
MPAKRKQLASKMVATKRPRIAVLPVDTQLDVLQPSTAIVAQTQGNVEASQPTEMQDGTLDRPVDRVALGLDMAVAEQATGNVFLDDSHLSHGAVEGDHGVYTLSRPDAASPVSTPGKDIVVPESPLSIADSDLEDPPDLENIPVDLQKRILKMRKEADADKGTYYLTKLPLDLQFGRADGFFDMRNFLVGSRNNAIRIFVCGILISSDFWNSLSQPQRRISVVVKPLTNMDSIAASKIYNEYSQPPERTTRDSFVHIQASRWQTSYGAPKDSPGLPFKQVYLAPGSMRDRTPHSIDLLGAGDLVVVEMRLRSRRGDMGGRTVEFQLQTVTVLKRDARPVTSVINERSEDVDW